MARIRTIKPQFFTSLSIGELTPVVRLTFIGLWTHADDEGRCIDDARLIKAAVSPLERTVQAIEGDINTLAKQGRIVRYRVGGRRYLYITNWHEHQRINRPQQSTIPAPEGVNDHGAITERSVNAHARKGKEGKGREVGVTQVSQSQAVTRGVDDDGLDKIRTLTGGTKAHATKCVEFVLAKAISDIRNPTAYVLAAIREDPAAYKFKRGNPKPDQECAIHMGEWADACRGCAIDRRVGDA